MGSFSRLHTGHPGDFCSRKTWGGWSPTSECGPTFSAAVKVHSDTASECRRARGLQQFKIHVNVFITTRKHSWSLHRLLTNHTSASANLKTKPTVTNAERGESPCASVAWTATCTLPGTGRAPGLGPGLACAMPDARGGQTCLHRQDLAPVSSRPSLPHLPSPLLHLHVLSSCPTVSIL